MSSRTQPATEGESPGFAERKRGVSLARLAFAARLPTLVAAVVVAAGLAGCSSPTDPPPASPIEVAHATVPAQAAPARAPTPPPARDGAGVPGAFAFVETLGATTWVVLAPGEADLAQGEPVHRTDPASSLVALEAHVATEDLDPSLRLHGRSVDLWKNGERRCRVRLGPTRLLGVTAMPDELLPPALAGVPVAPPTAGQVWPFARFYLAAEVRLPHACGGASWARLAELPEPRFPVERAAVEPAVTTDLGARFRAAAGWGSAQADYDDAQARSNQPAGPWGDAATTSLRAWDDPASGVSWMLQQALWDEGCGASAGLTMVWRAASGATTVRFEGDDRSHADLVLDLEGDGRLEMLVTDGIGGRSLRPFWGEEATGLVDRESYLEFAVPSHGCGC